MVQSVSKTAQATMTLTPFLDLRRKGEYIVRHGWPKPKDELA
jgi:hypothetical protein